MKRQVMKRQAGFYWVLLGANWIVAAWYNIAQGWWMQVGTDIKFVDSDFNKIDERRLPEPSKRMWVSKIPIGTFFTGRVIGEPVTRLFYRCMLGLVEIPHSNLRVPPWTSSRTSWDITNDVIDRTDLAIDDYTPIEPSKIDWELYSINRQGMRDV